MSRKTEQWAPRATDASQAEYLARKYKEASEAARDKGATCKQCGYPTNKPTPDLKCFQHPGW